jgi:hypothetical protein
MRTITRFLVVALVVGTSVAQAAGPPTVKSLALSPETQVDGLITDWPTLWSVTKEVSVAAANNHDRLVIAIATSDTSVKQRLLAAGVIVYLDPKGNKAKTFGVRIPPARGGFSAGQQSEVTYVEVLGPAEKEIHIVDLGERAGFEVVRGDNHGTLLIELAIPLRTSDGVAFAAPVNPSRKAIGLGLVTPDVPTQGRGQPGEGGRGGPPGGGGMGGGGIGGGGGMGGSMGRGGGGGMGGPGGGQGPGGSHGKELKVWTSLELAREKRP